MSAIKDTYEVELYAGAVGEEEEIGQFRAFRQSNQAGAAPSPMMTPIQPANTRISAKCATENGGCDTINIAVFYHTYT